MSEPTQPVSISLTKSLVEGLDALSLTAGLSRSAAVRLAVDTFLREHKVSTEGA